MRVLVDVAMGWWEWVIWPWVGGRGSVGVVVGRPPIFQMDSGYESPLLRQGHTPRGPGVTTHTHTRT